MEATKLTSIYEILRELFDKLNSKTTWEDMPFYVYTHYYTKTGKLRGNNWRIIKYLKNHGLETEDKFEDMVVFWNNNQKTHFRKNEDICYLSVELSFILSEQKNNIFIIKCVFFLLKKCFEKIKSPSPII